MLYRWSFAEKTCSPQSNTSNKRKVNNWSVLAKPKQNMAFTQFCAHCALWLSSLTKLQTITFNMNGNGLTTTSQFSQLTSISSSWQWKTTCTYSGIWPLGNWICSQFDLHHFHHFCEWDILNFGNFWNPSIKRNNVPHNKTFIILQMLTHKKELTCIHRLPGSCCMHPVLKCQRWLYLFPTQSNVAWEFMLFFLTYWKRLQWKDVYIHGTLLNVCLAYHHFLPLKWSKYSLNDLRTQTYYPYKIWYSISVFVREWNGHEIHLNIEAF